ncbi:hypothetical protein Tco_0873791 [Tanacetum coccineum]|uniref:Reverse transcriptase domain-containing protein n=1 Tax=Tanacetum coccineum TaxID=301880 RepID=A0ABQ5BJT4_9ASTR
MKSRDFNKDLMRRFMKHGTDSTIFFGHFEHFHPEISSDVAELKDMVKALLLDKKNQSPAPTPVKAVEESCVTCGGAHIPTKLVQPPLQCLIEIITKKMSSSKPQLTTKPQGNTGYRASISNQIRPPGVFSSSNNHNVQKSSKQSESYKPKNRGNFKSAPAYQPPRFIKVKSIKTSGLVQPPAYQSPAYQHPAPPIQGYQRKFPTYVKANDAVMRNMQTQGYDKLPVIIAKDLKNEEKAALIEVLKSHKRAIAWKLSDIKGINPEFCTHKILMEEDYEPTVQHQRRVIKDHDVINKEVERTLDAD